MTGCDCCGVAREGGAVLSLVPKRAEADESTSWVNSLTSPDGGLAAGRFSRSIQSEIAAGQFVGAVAVVAGQNVSWTETIYAAGHRLVADVFTESGLSSATRSTACAAPRSTRFGAPWCSAAPTQTTNATAITAGAALASTRIGAASRIFTPTWVIRRTVCPWIAPTTTPVTDQEITNGPTPLCRPPTAGRTKNADHPRRRLHGSRKGSAARGRRRDPLH